MIQSPPKPCLSPSLRRVPSSLKRLYRRAIRSSAFAAALLSVPLLGTPFHANASLHGDMRFPHALTPAFRWSEPIEMHLSGVPVVVRSFVAASTLEQAARAMARHKNRFQRVTTLPGSILLSGVHQGRHWVAQIEALPGQVKGMVSALPMEFEQEAGGTELTGSLAPWLTQNARFVFGQASGRHGPSAAQTVHVPNRPIGEFIGALEGRLLKQGWQRSGAHSWISASATGKSGQGRIDLFPVRHPLAGTAVLIHQTE